MRYLILVITILAIPTLVLSESPTLTCPEKLEEYSLRLKTAENNLQLCQFDKDFYEQAFVDMHISYVEHIFNEYYPTLEKLAEYKKENRRLKRELKKYR